MRENILREHFKKFISKLETYLLVVIHPFKIHQQFHSQIPLYSYDSSLQVPLTLAESLGFSWIFSFLRGLFRIIFLNLFLNLLFTFQSDSLSLLEEMMRDSGLMTYSFFLITLALDVIFFPIGQFILTEFWSFLIKFYAKILNPQLPVAEISQQISVHALSSNVFLLIPVVGDVIQSFYYIFLLYAGLRANLCASRSLSLVILMTPILALIMLIALILVIGFYFAA